MLITHEMFGTFTNRPIASETTTQVLLAIEVDSRDQVDKIVNLAIENGAKDTKIMDGCITIVLQT